MKSQFLFFAVPAAALIAPAGFAVVYLGDAQAQQEIFPGRTCSPAPLTLTPEQRKRIERTSGVRLLKNDPKVWKVSGGGWFIVDQVIGKHEYITYAVGLSEKGAVVGIEIMEYRESYGGEVRDAKWRSQFTGKTSAAPLVLDRDIKNISGATLSSRHVTEGVRRILAVYEEALR